MRKNQMIKRAIYTLTLLCLLSISAGAGGFKTFLEYEDLVRSSVREAGLPERFCYLPLVLTDCNPDYSDTYTVGAWALAGPVARTYGLTVSTTYDARRDMALSTNAAVTYLKALYFQFEGDECKTLAKYFTVAHRTALAADPQEAIRKLDRCREELGEYYVPDDCALEEVVLKGAVNVTELCDALIVPFSSLKYWNPAVSAFAEYLPEGAMLRIPVAKFDSFRRKESALYDSAKENMPKVQTPQERTSLVMSGNAILPEGSDAVTSVPTDTARPAPATTRKPASSGPKPIYHIVKPGENLGGIARKYNTSVSKIVKDNKLKSADKIRDGQKLKIYKNVK